MLMTTKTVNTTRRFAPLMAQIATSAFPLGKEAGGFVKLYGLSREGTVYEYDFRKEVWVPLNHAIEECPTPIGSPT